MSMRLLYLDPAQLEIDPDGVREDPGRCRRSGGDDC